eukprot:TRINITY_DN1640_c0_g1_i1.p1 TRINITY_DN1640_c0_g1~~TRINITY_DN1640_c0_g1_i1.p1  ORF type:complete len:368 (+),score=113.51 TRINITY_DN1640_c0_g1_i1:1071-2174(+)
MNKHVARASNGMYVEAESPGRLPSMPPSLSHHHHHHHAHPHHQISLGSGNVTGNVIPPKAKTIAQLIATTAVEDLVVDRGSLVSLFASDDVCLALRTVKDSGLHAVPIYDPNDKFLGLFDCHDALAYFCSMKDDTPLSVFLNHPISDLAGTASSSEDKITVMKIGTPLNDVIKVIINQSSTRRVEVIDHAHVSPSLFNVVSEMSVIKFIAKNISLLEKEVANMKVSEIMCQIIDVDTIPSDTIARDAFKYIHNRISRDVGAAAVVDCNTGNIVDTLSVSDIIGFTHEQASDMLSHSVLDYLATTRRTKCLKPPITVTMDDTMENVILKLSSVQVHRLWVVDSTTSRYLGFITTTHVLSSLSRKLEIL